MAAPKYLKCSCQQCGGRIEYPADAVGSMVECPHCHWQTELMVEVPESETPAFALSTKWIIIGVLLFVLAGLGAAAPVILKHLAKRRPGAQVIAPAAPRAAQTPIARAVKNEFEVGALSVERAGTSSLTYVNGSVRNMLGKQRFSVRVHLECLDASGNVIATASDYAAVIDPRAEWRFRALVLKGAPIAARLADITEER